jgi:hypothetical protein
MATAMERKMGKEQQSKQLTCSTAALSTKIDKFSLPEDDDEDEDEDESSDEEEVTHKLFDPPKKEEEAWQQLKGKTFSFHNAPGICWPCGRNKQIRPRLTCRLLCLWKGGFSFQ